MTEEEKDSIRKVCKILDIDDDQIITFEDFVEAQFKKPYEEVKDDPQVQFLRKAWNKSCESLLNILDGISIIAEQLDHVKFKPKESDNG